MAVDGTTGAAQTDSEHVENKWYASAAALSVGILCILFGIPLWWKTTAVYRADVPYQQIQDLGIQKVILGVDLEVVSADGSNKVELAKLGEALHSIFADPIDQKLIRVSFQGKVRLAHAEERTAFESSHDITEFESQLSAAESPGQYTVYILPEQWLSGAPLPHIGARRNVYIRHNMDPISTAAVIQEVFHHVINKESVQKTYAVAAGHFATEKTDKDHMRAVKSSPTYDVVFSLLIADPNQGDTYWDFESAMRDYLSPLKSLLSKHVDLKIKSQVLYYTPLAVEPKKNAETGEHYLLLADLPHLINPFEAKLGSFVAKNPALNFLAYVPRRAEWPLHIHSEPGVKADIDAFLSPRWGGFFVYNGNSKDDLNAQNNSGQVDMKSIMEVFLPQLRLLLGVHQHSAANVHVSLPGANAVTSWELDSWLRERAVENLAKCSQTLASLTQLVDKIRNMVINDDVSSKVLEAVEAAARGYTHLAEGRLSDAFAASQQAVAASEDAFFDPSLLELLYFPEDQKFAIYIPLFLPIGLPIITSTIAAVKWFRSQRMKAKRD